MTRIRDLHKRWMQDPEYCAEHDAATEALELMAAMSEARENAGLTQEQLAERMETTHSAVARLEGWTANPSVETLRRFSKATGTRLKIGFEPIEDESSVDVGEGSTAIAKCDAETMEDESVDEHPGVPVGLPV